MKNLSGLKWITPSTASKKDLELEVELLNYFKNILKRDQEKKIVLTNYSFFSVLLNDNISGYSRWYPGDNSAFPVKGNYYLKILKIL